MKLGLVIKIVDNGEREGIAINKDHSWAQYISDVGSAIKCLDNFDGTGKDVLLATFLGSAGYLLTLIVSRPGGSGRSGDYTAAWIHVPAICNILAEHIINVIESVKNALSGKYGIDGTLLHNVFEQEMEEEKLSRSAVETIKSNDNASEYAVRFYGYGKNFTLKELLGKSIAQKEYSDYKGIFFVDANKGITSSCKELKFEPKVLCTISPIQDIFGFEAYLDENTPFKNKIELPCDSQITIYWKKAGYSTIKKTSTVKEACLYDCDCLKMTPNDYYIEISCSSFDVRDAEEGYPITDFMIYINGTSQNSDTIKISETEYKQGVKLRVKANGYDEFEQQVKLDTNNKTSIKLHKIVHSYRFIIPISTEEDKKREERTRKSVFSYDRHSSNDFSKKENKCVSKKERLLFEIKTNRELSKSPIKGYSLNDNIHDGDNELIYDNQLMLKLKCFGIGFITCFVLLVLYAGYQAVDNYKFNFGWPPFKEIPQESDSVFVDTSSAMSDEGLYEEVHENTDSINAVAYLNQNIKWHKDSLENYNTTKGLFDALNGFNKDYIEIVRKKTGEVQRLDYIINTFNKHPEYDPSIGKDANDGKYNKDDDKKIVISRYIAWISVKHEPSSSSHSSAGNLPKPRPSDKNQSTPSSTSDSNGRGGNK